MAVNREYAPEGTPLAAGDGAGAGAAGGARPAGVSANALGVPAPWVRVSGQGLARRLVERVSDRRAGAVVTFQGVTREVERLDYEVYVEMAQERMAAIAAEAIARHALCAAAVEHRVGPVPLSEPSGRRRLGAPPRRGVRRRARSSTASRRRRRSGRRRWPMDASAGSRASGPPADRSARPALGGGAVGVAARRLEADRRAGGLRGDRGGPGRDRGGGCGAGERLVERAQGVAVACRRRAR